MARIGIIALGAAFGLTGCAVGPIDEFPFEDHRLDPLTSNTLETFDNERDFRQYLRSVADQAADRGYWWNTAVEIGAKALHPDNAPPPSTPCASDVESDCDTIIVTGSRIATPNPTITNNQNLGVDEGDIIKQIGSFLVVLQDGRLLSIDTRPGDQHGLEYIDRIDVYRDADRQIWYDEMLVTGHRVVVTGYSYEDEATEVTIIALTEDGRFEREDTFLISADDYYDSENYATRIVGDQFISYNRQYLSEVSPNREVELPVIRRWVSDDERSGTIETANALVHARSIYRPVIRTLQPVLHSISICDIGGIRPPRVMDCETTALIAPEQSEFYVSGTHAYLWTSPGWDETAPEDLDAAPSRAECRYKERPAARDALPAALYQLSIQGGDTQVARVLGYPPDQFAMNERAHDFQALVHWYNPYCDADDVPSHLALMTLPAHAFGEELRALPAGRYDALPALVDQYSLDSRFTETHLIYGWSRGDFAFPPDKGDTVTPAQVVSAPLDAPEHAQQISVPHSILRLERAGNRIVLTGYPDHQGLQISLLDVDDAPHFTDHISLAGRRESEGRSHAFNSHFEPDGSGIMGLPTVEAPEGARRWWWRSQPSDLSYLSIGPDGQLARLGELVQLQNSEHADYECEVSCIDWYGNSRPIFTGGRIFALSGTELVEGAISNGEIKAIRRANLTAPSQRETEYTVAETAH
jgi:hypothetical protein